MKTWEEQDGVAFLRDIGVRQGDKVLDFGSRVGHYSIPAAFAVGRRGMVYALDKDSEPLDQLIGKAKELGLSNIKTMRTPARIDVAVENNTINVVLLYDVLHYFALGNRRRLYQEAFRVLKPNGLLSVYPKHTAEDTPAQQLKDMHVRDVEREIRMSGFEPDGQWEAILSHDEGLQHGRVLNFRKHRSDVEPLGGNHNVKQ